MTGTTPGGIAYRRVDSCHFNVVPRDARFAEGAVVFEGVDDDANQLIDRLVVSAPIEVLVAGEYALSGLIERPSGEPLVAWGTATFEPGAASMQASIRAEEVLYWGEYGPFTLVELELSRILPEDEYIVDRLALLDIQTPAYGLNNYERAALELTGTIIDYGLDLDNDGLWDRLVVRVGVRCAQAGLYAYSYDVADACGGTISFATGHATFAASEAEQFAQLTFDGGLIGLRGIDGPYRIRNMLMYGPSESLAASGTIGETGTYAATAFECFTPPWDCNNNGVPDACDLAAGIGTDLNYDGILDECCPPGTWTAMPDGPSARVFHAMAYDSARHVSVMFGGRPGATGHLGDTWVHDGTSWQQRTGPAPTARNAHAMCFDPIRDRVVLFGGQDASGLRGDTWEWDGTTWLQRSTTGPNPRIGHVLVFNSSTGRSLLFGGAGGQGEYFDDTWEWDGTAWTQVQATGPSGRYGCAAAYDSVNLRVLLFGGAGDESGAQFPFFSDELWQFQNGAWTLLNVGGPAGRYGPAVTFDPERGSFILFGGSFWHPRWELFCDTWEWRGGQWARGADNGPGDRTGATMVYQNLAHRAFMYGGLGPDGNLRDAWHWAGPAVPFIAERPTIMSVNFGEELAIDMLVLGDSPLLRWDKDSVEIEDDERISGSTTASLRIVPARMSDEGLYRLEASNGCVTHDAALYVSVICRADFDQNGVVDVPDQFAFLAAWFGQDPSADFDGMNGVDVPDIFAFLTAWFAGC